MRWSSAGPMAGLVLTCAWPIWGLDPTLALTQYVHTGWSGAEDGAPSQVTALAQTADGYLWMGAPSGLYRFDGLTFSHQHAGTLTPSLEVRALLRSADDSLWVGLADGLGVFRGGRFTRYQVGSAAGRLFEDSSRSVWALAGGYPRQTLVRVAGGKVAVFGRDQGLPAPVLAVTEDLNKQLWLGTGSGLCKWDQDRTSGCWEPRSRINCLHTDASGRLVLCDAAEGGMRLWEPVRGTSERLLPLKGVAVTTTLRDRQGILWVGTVSDGLMRVRNGQIESMRRADGLTANQIEALLEDAEGNLWIGTASGLDRLRNPQLPHLTTSEGLSGDLVTAVAPASAKGIWAATGGAGLNLIEPGPAQENRATQPAFAAAPGKVILSLHRDPRGTLWVGSSQGLFELQSERFAPAAAFEGRRPVPLAITSTGETLWILDAERRLLQLQANRTLARPSAGPLRADPYRILGGKDGTLWIGFYGGGVSRLRGNTIDYTAPPAGCEGPVLSIQEDTDGEVWFGTGSGMIRYREGGGWTCWGRDSGSPATGVRAMIFDQSGALWISGGADLFRIGREQLKKMRAGEAIPMELMHGESLRTGSGSKSTGPLMANTSDGRIWIATEAGVAVLNAAQVMEKPAPPPAAIEAITADSRPIQPGLAATPEFFAQEVQFRYTAPSLSHPQGTSFRYRIEGYHNNWLEAGTQRQVSFSGLPPGPYSFCVQARSQQGVLSQIPVCAPFAIKPRFYQTTIGRVSGLLLVSLIVWGLHHWRLGRLQDRYNALLGERMRIARELHDTLMQGFAGVTYQLQAVAKLMGSEPEASRNRLMRAIDQADSSMAEARHAIYYLRLSALEKEGLTEAIRSMGVQLTRDSGVEFEVHSNGSFDRLPPFLEGTIYMIASEAIHNAVKHSRATHVTVILERGITKGIQLTIEDDGCGFDPSVELPGHYGLNGMRERANMGGLTLEIASQPGKGTKVVAKTQASVLRLPRAAAG